jgi:hypothetical protein
MMEDQIESGEIQSATGSYEEYVQGVMDGKSRYQAALDAGFSKNKAAHASRLIEGPVTDRLMSEALARVPSGQSRSERYVEGLMDGKSKAQAALDAGYSTSEARNPTARIEGPITEELKRRSLENAGITLDLLAAKMRRGLEATRAFVLPRGWGEAPTVEKVEDFATQLRYIQHAHKILFNAGPEEAEPQKWTIRIVDVGGPVQPEQLVREYTTDYHKP